MRVSRTGPRVELLALAIILLAGCDDPTRPPQPGAIGVTVSVSGTDVSQSGYRLSVDNGAWQALDPGVSGLTFFDLEPGPHTVRLDGLAPNCAVIGPNPITVTVVSDRTTQGQFNVTCVANVGTVRLTTVTTGDDLDPNGYEARVDGERRGDIGINGALSISDVQVGSRTISLGGVASNCTIAAPHPVNVNVVFHGTVDVAFTIQCVSTGSLEVTVATTGVDLDADGYTVQVQSPTVGDAESLDVASNGAVTFRLRPASDYQVTLQDVSANCDVVGIETQTVAVVAGSTTRVTFAVSCEEARLLAIEREGDIYVISSNGTGATRLTTDPGFEGNPAWSSRGRIAFVTTRDDGDAELYAVNDDGTGTLRLTTSAGVDVRPSWSPDGQRIVFQSGRDVNDEIYVMNADGTGLSRLTNNTASDRDPAWSSTGKIVFISTRDHASGEIYAMNADGSNVIRLTANDSVETGPTWSPDGSMIAFAREIRCYYYCTQDIFVMNADGSSVKRLTTSAPDNVHADPSWSPDGRTIAFTNQYCPYYCDRPTVWIVDVQGTQLVQLADNAAHPAWKP